MGSVSSLISGHSLHTKHCRASEPRLKKNCRKAGRSLDGLLKHGFTDHGSNNNTKTGYRSGKSEDFFYIKVSHKTPLDQKRGATPELERLPAKLEKGSEKSLIRPTAFKPVLPRSSSSSVETHNNLSTILGSRISPIDRPKDTQDPKQENSSGTLSDSGRNSMSSLPTHSTSGSSQLEHLSTSTGHMLRYGGSSPHPGLDRSTVGLNRSSESSWVDSGGNNAVNGNNSWISSSGEVHGDSSATKPTTRSIGVLSDGVSGLTAVNMDVTPVDPEVTLDPSPTKSGGGVRSPITTDESLILQLERKLLERESELADLQSTFEEKESDTCQLFEEKQRYCAEEMAGLKQRCSTKLRQASQRAVRAQQLLQGQVIQLQQDKDQLQEEVYQLTQEREAAENQLRAYKSQQTQLSPTLEETQWEVCQKTGEISLLKQQLKDAQADVGNKLSEIVSLKGSLRDLGSRLEELEQKNRECEEALHTRSTEAEVCQNELQRKKNEADLLREKVGRLETDIKGMKQELSVAKEEQIQLQSLRAKLEEQQLQLQISQAKMEVFGVKEQPCEVRERSINMDALQKEVERLRGQLREEKEKKGKLVGSFQQERHTWNKEKDKVIRYQKQLQYNYLQMLRKNRDLEKILRELTAEMDSRTELDVDAHSPEIRCSELVATQI
ncbi:leucine zipper putative tumor suppressor 1 [Astyanax mexicanus]|uniref:leucine zipper putative tumor suppressor 1 n=1 Tax=Astyanax mexicanus TaxID=7994 RepID=UPI0020CB49D9|nr:leucine zipper putative tumor suppressor 1 [Astyanax mexicanus]XP_015460794.3 leucine zipper putative tumor suppressor 1 [Astyanax mexicanus]